MNLIILEGPDGGGKTTLARRLAALGYAVVKFNVPPAAARRSAETLLRFFLTPLLRADRAGRPTVFDRCHLSERIYAPLARGGTLFTAAAERLVERFLAARGAAVVLCLPSTRVALAGWLRNQRREYLKDISAWRRADRAYRRLARADDRVGHWFTFDWTRLSANSFARALKELAPATLPPGCAGSPAARFLLIGERPNKPPDLPFTATRGASAWLNGALADAGYREPELALTNARTPRGGVRDLAQVFASFNGAPPTLITLGRVATAAARATASAWPIYELPHPQFIKRFHTRERARFVARLAEIRRRSP